MSSGFRVQIKAGSIKFKPKLDGRTAVEVQPAFASVSDKLKRGDRKKIVRGKRVK